jgi:hypothetical protein
VEPLGGRLGAVCTAKASGISRSAAKSGCACEWGGWGRLSVDGPRQKNSDRSEGPGVERQKPFARRCFSAQRPPTQNGEPRYAAGSAKDGGKPSDTWAVSHGQALSETPALKPYRGKPAVRNFREGNGNVGIIRSPLRAIALPDQVGSPSGTCPTGVGNLPPGESGPRIISECATIHPESAGRTPV